MDSTVNGRNNLSPGGDLAGDGNKMPGDSSKPRGGFKDSLDSKEIKTFSWLYSQICKSSISFQDVESAQEFVKGVKDGIVGRLAGDIDDYVSLYLINRYLDLEAQHTLLPHVEIGTLFGGSAIVSLKGLRDGGHKSQVICIDPLDGYYVHQHIGEKTDAISKTPITRESLVQNLTSFGFNENDYVILQNLSTDPAIAAYFEGKKIRSAYIDGDHSYDGISKDWELLSPLVVEGGFIVIDNVCDLAWPDVSKFILDKIYADRTWKFEAMFSRSLILTRNEALNNRQGVGRSHFLYHHKMYLKYRSSYLNLQKANKELADARARIKSLEEQLQSAKG